MINENKGVKELSYKNPDKLKKKKPKDGKSVSKPKPVYKQSASKKPKK